MSLPHTIGGGLASLNKYKSRIYCLKAIASLLDHNLISSTTYTNKEEDGNWDQGLISTAEGTHSVTHGSPHTQALCWRPSPRSLPLCSNLQCDLEDAIQEY